MATLDEDDPLPERPGRPAFRWRDLLPSPGNALLVLVAAAALLVYVRAAGAGPAGAPTAASTATIPYQGRLADSGGSPLSGSYPMTFKLYNVASNGSALWTETWSGSNSIIVTNGLFNVLLGSVTPIPPSLFSANSSLWLGVAVGGDGEMAPRVQLGSAPFAIHSVTVPNESIGPAQISNSIRTVAGVLSAENIYPTSQGAELQFPTTGDSYIQGRFLLPEDYAGGDVTLRIIWRNHDVPGTVKLLRSIYILDSVTGGESPLVVEVSADEVPLTQNETSIREVAVSSGLLSARDIVKVVYRRLGDDGADTAGRMQVGAMTMEYVSTR